MSRGDRVNTLGLIAIALIVVCGTAHVLWRRSRCPHERVGKHFHFLGLTAAQSSATSVALLNGHLASLGRLRAAFSRR